MLLCLVNDILDLKLIEENKFVSKNELFSPRETFKFITNMFAPQVEMQNSTLSFTEMEKLTEPGQSSMQILGSLVPQPQNRFLPDKLLGDQIRLK